MLKPITTENSINTRKPCHDPKQMKQTSASIMINVFIYLIFFSFSFWSVYMIQMPITGHTC